MTWRQTKRRITLWLTGLALIVIALPVLWFNEKGAALSDASPSASHPKIDHIVHVDGVDPKNEGMLVHVTGDVATDAELVDDLGVRVKALRVVRDVQMLQWRETVAREGTKEPTYSYAKVWSSTLIPSGAFVQPGHENPTAMKVESAQLTADDLDLAGFELSPALVTELDKASVPFEPDAAVLAAHGVPAPTPGKLQVGDVSVHYSIVKSPQTMSVVGQQVGSSLEPYDAADDNHVLIVALGAKDAAAMYQLPPSRAATRWGTRGIGLAMLLAGLAIVLSPIWEVVEILPPGHTFEVAGGALVGAMCAPPTALLIIALAWIRYRPVLGLSAVAAVLVACVGLVMFVRRAKTKKASRIAAAATANG